MKHYIAILLILSFIPLGLSQKKAKLKELKSFVATETYPADVFLDTVKNKKALIIVAHDDDDGPMSGTIAKLSSQGWKIKQLSLQRHLIPNRGKNPADIICEGNELILKDGNYRKGLDTMKTPYMPIPYTQIKEQFLSEKVSDSLIKLVNEFNPSVIFTLDNEKGGYGHPEHVFISQLVLDLFLSKKITCQKLYQSVYTDHMEKQIVDIWLAKKMKKWGFPNVSDIANALYGIDGMPDPTCSIDITKVAEIKMSYLMTYDENVRNNLRKYIPYYDEFDAKTYFNIFNKEYFRVIDKI